MRTDHVLIKADNFTCYGQLLLGAANYTPPVFTRYINAINFKDIEGKYMRNILVFTAALLLCLTVPSAIFSQTSKDCIVVATNFPAHLFLRGILDDR